MQFSYTNLEWKGYILKMKKLMVTWNRFIVRHKRIISASIVLIQIWNISSYTRTVYCSLLMSKLFISQATWEAVQGHKCFWLHWKGSYTHSTGECYKASLPHAGAFVSWRSRPAYWGSSIHQQTRLTILFIGIRGLCNLRVPPFWSK